MTVTEFLEARIAEDETEAQECIRKDVWYVYPGCFDPARVLAECAAKRAILAECRPGTLDDLDCGEDDSPAPMWVARALAAVYSDHPDYNKDWAL